MEGEVYLLTERMTGPLSRSLRLPRDADEDTVRAQYTDGVLRICLSKKPHGEEGTGAKTIRITEDYPFAK